MTCLRDLLKLVYCLLVCHVRIGKGHDAHNDVIAKIAKNHTKKWRSTAIGADRQNALVLSRDGTVLAFYNVTSQTAGAPLLESSNIVHKIVSFNSSHWLLISSDCLYWLVATNIQPDLTATVEIFKYHGTCSGTDRKETILGTRRVRRQIGDAPVFSSLELVDGFILSFKIDDNSKIQQIVTLTLRCSPSCQPAVEAHRVIRANQGDWRSASFFVTNYNERAASVRRNSAGIYTFEMNVFKFGVKDRQNTLVSVGAILDGGKRMSSNSLQIVPRARITFAGNYDNPDPVVEVLASRLLRIKLFFGSIRSTPPTKFKISKIGDQNIELFSPDLNNRRELLWRLTESFSSINYYVFDINADLPSIILHAINGAGEEVTAQRLNLALGTTTPPSTTTLTATSTDGGVEKTTPSEDIVDEPLISSTMILLILLSILITFILLAVVSVALYVRRARRRERRERAPIVKTNSKIVTNTVFKLEAMEIPPLADKIKFYNVDQYDVIKSDEGNNRKKKKKEPGRSLMMKSQD